MPAAGRLPRIAYASGNGFSSLKAMKTVRDKHALWNAMAARQVRGRDLWAAWFTGDGPSIYAAVSTDDGATFGHISRSPCSGEASTTPPRPEIGALPDERLAVLYQALRTDGVRWRYYDRCPAAGVTR